MPTDADHIERACRLCAGRCPLCGGDVAPPAGRGHWVLCALCHATFSHDPGHPEDEEARDVP